jgi:hypothetical protein
MRGAGRDAGGEPRAAGRLPRRAGRQLLLAWPLLALQAAWLLLAAQRLQGWRTLILCAAAVPALVLIVPAACDGAAWLSPRWLLLPAMLACLLLALCGMLIGQLRTWLVAVPLLAAAGACILMAYAARPAWPELPAPNRLVYLADTPSWRGYWIHPAGPLDAWTRRLIPNAMQPYVMRAPVNHHAAGFHAQDRSPLIAASLALAFSAHAAAGPTQAATVQEAPLRAHLAFLVVRPARRPRHRPARRRPDRRYLETQAWPIGLQAGQRRASYRQSVKIAGERRCRRQLGGAGRGRQALPLAFGKDWVWAPGDARPVHDMDAELVFVGYGITRRKKAGTTTRAWTSRARCWS